MLGCFDRDALPARPRGDRLRASTRDGSTVATGRRRGRPATSRCAPTASARRPPRLLPDVAPVYAGYVAWRGMVPETELDRGDRRRARRRDHVLRVRQQPHPRLPDPGRGRIGRAGRAPDQHRLVSQLPRRRRSRRCAARRRTGVRREVSVPPGAARAEHIAELRATAASAAAGRRSPTWCCAHRRAVRAGRSSISRCRGWRSGGPACSATRRSSSGRTPRRARPRRPPTHGRWATRWRRHDDVPSALAAWEPGQLALGRSLLERTRRIGAARRSTATGGRRSRADLRPDGARAMSEPSGRAADSGDDVAASPRGWPTPRPPVARLARRRTAAGRVVAVPGRRRAAAVVLHAHRPRRPRARRTWTPPQQRLALRLVASGLSRAGYVTSSTIMGLENVLDQLEGCTAQFDRPHRGRDPVLYYVRVFGDPASGARGRGASAAITCRSTTPSSTAWCARRRRVPRCRPGELAAARPASAAPARRRRGPGPRAGPFARRRPAGAAVVAPVRPTDLVGRQPARAARRRPAAAVARHLARRFRATLGGAPGGQATTGRGGDRAAARATSRRVRLTLGGPQGHRRAALDGDQREMLRAVLDVYVEPAARRAGRRRGGQVRRRPAARRVTSRGRAGSSRASRTTTGSRGRGCWSSTTTPSATPTTSTPCGAIRTATSATTSWPTTTPPTTST